MLKEFKLGSEAISYIRSQLGLGYSLAQHLLNLPLEQGQVTTYLPALTSDEAKRSFDKGGVVDRSEEPLHKVVTLVSAFLREQVKGYAVFEGFWRDRSLFATAKEQHLFYEPEAIYYFASSANPDPVYIEAAVRAGRSYPYIGVLTSLPEGKPDIQSGTNVTSQQLRELASRAQHIVVGSYDDEGYLIWARR